MKVVQVSDGGAGNGLSEEMRFLWEPEVKFHNNYSSKHLLIADRVMESTSKKEEGVTKRMGGQVTGTAIYPYNIAFTAHALENTGTVARRNK